MTRSIIKVACAVLIMLIIIAGASACTTKTIDEIAEIALQAWDDCDYDTFLEYYTPADRSLLTKDEFDEVCRLLQETIGEYIDKEFWKTEEDVEQGHTIVYYKANYSDEPEDVIVTFYFEEVDGRNYIAHLWFDSPKLGLAYASQITENILLAMNENDYAKFSEHFNEAMKNALPEATFQQTVSQIEEALGDYVSKTFWKLETVDGYTDVYYVYYKAKFTLEDEVTVKVGFLETEGKVYVGGLWFDHPELGGE